MAREIERAQRFEIQRDNAVAKAEELEQKLRDREDGDRVNQENLLLLRERFKADTAAWKKMLNMVSG